MDPIEKAIRTALDKGDVDDPDFRQRVYRSVEAALDRAIQANPQLTVERAIARRRGLKAKIAEIEAEFTLARPADDPFEGSLNDALRDIFETDPRAPAVESPAVGAASRPAEDWSAATRSAPGADDLSSAVPSPAGPEGARQGESELDDALSSLRASRGPAPARPAASAASGRQEPSFGDPAPAPVPPPAARRAAPAHPGRQEPDFDMGELPELPSDETDAEVGPIPPPLDLPDISAPVPESPPDIVAVDRAARSREKRRPFAAFFLGAALLSLAAAGFMFALQTGLLKSPEERDTSVPNPPQTLESEDFDPAARPPALADNPASEQNWITIFTPSNPDTARAPENTSVEPMQDEAGAYLRVRSGDGSSSVSFDIDQSALEQLAGGRAIFNVVARAEEGRNTEISIECDFGELGDCGRKRYEVGYERGEYLFEINFADKQPGASGTLTINSDISGEGKAIDIYEIKAARQ